MVEKIAKLSQNFLSVTFLIAFVGTVLIFIVGPARSIANTLGVAPEKLASLFSPLLMVMALTTWALFLWKNLASPSPAPASSLTSPRPRYSKGQTLILISLLAALFGQALWQSDVPLDWDEHEHVTLLASPDWKRAVNPFLGSENHALASLSTFASMKLFGVSKFAARLPALCYALFFLATLFFFSRTFLSPVVAIPLFVLVAFNPMVIYTLHQMRGYTPLLGFSLLSLTCVLCLLFTPPAPRERRFLVAVFFLSATLGIASHTFGGLFLGFLFLSLLHFGYFYRRYLTPTTIQTIQTLCWGSTALLLAYAVLSVFILLHLQDTGFAGRTGELPAWLKTLMLYRPFTLFGMVRIWEIKLTALAIVILGFVAATRATFTHEGFPRPVHFASLFLAILVTFFTLSAVTLKFTVLEGRMLQPFVIIFFWFVLDSIFSLQKKWLRLTTLGAVLALFLLPGWLHHDQSDEVAAFFTDTERFAKMVEEQIKPFPKRCLSFSGDPSSVGYYQHFYFHDEPKGASCASPFRIHIEHGLFDRVTPLSEDLVHFTLLLSDRKGRTLYQMTTAETNLTASDL